jgi:diguanylate cyclase (GGDEF)-like protein
VNIDSTQTFQSPYSVQRRTGFGALRFAGDLENEFCEHYAQISLSRARVMPSFAIMMTVINMVMRLSSDEPQAMLWFFDLAILLPTLIAALYFSTQPERYRLYQVMLSLGGLLSGIVITSIVISASQRGMPYYFAMEVAWVFALWLILGLRFRSAAITAILVSGVYIIASLYQEIEMREAGFATIMLFLVNGIGATVCYHLEFAVRSSFLESRALGKIAKELGDLAQLDGLTGLHNRRSYDTFIDRIWRQSKREQAQLTILLIDIDHFKNYNDHYGHQTGDDALKAVASVIGASAKRPLDFAARYGGEEFVLALYGQGGDSGSVVAERIRKGIKDLAIPHVKSSTGDFLTASIGVAIIMPDADRSLDGAVQMADEALYQAKEEGRDRVLVKESGSTQMQTGIFRAASA